MLLDQDIMLPPDLSARLNCATNFFEPIPALLRKNKLEKSKKLATKLCHRVFDVKNFTNSYYKNNGEELKIMAGKNKISISSNHIVKLTF